METAIFGFKIAGHEPCGQIAAIGSGVSRFRVGDRVVAYHIAGCGLCAACRAGWMISGKVALVWD